MILVFKHIVIIIVLLNIFWVNICKAEPPVKGSIYLGIYVGEFRVKHQAYQMKLLLNEGLDTFSTSINNLGIFEFSKSGIPSDSICLSWDFNAISKMNKCEFFIFPKTVCLNGSSPYDLFSYKRFNDIHVNQRREILRKVDSGKLEEAKKLLDKLFDIYSLAIEVDNKDAQHKAIVLLNDIAFKTNGYRHKIGISKCCKRDLEIEQLWLREAIIKCADPCTAYIINSKDLSHLSQMTIALNNWSLFTRKVYSNRQKRWPRKSISEITDSELRDPTYKDWLTQDIECVRYSVYEDEKIRDVLKEYIQNSNLDVLSERLKQALKSFPNNLSKDPEEINLSQLSHLLNGLFQLTKTDLQKHP